MYDRQRQKGTECTHEMYDRQTERQEETGCTHEMCDRQTETRRNWVYSRDVQQTDKDKKELGVLTRCTSDRDKKELGVLTRCATD